MGNLSIWHLLIVVAAIAVLFPSHRIIERAGRHIAQRVRDWIG